MRARLKPPEGVTARLGGLPVLVAGANDDAVGPAAAARDAAGRAARRRARAAARLPALGAGAGAARADRAGHGLVGARAVRDAGAAEPDVGDARRARDRDLDRVRGAARARASARSARAGWSRPTALRATYASTGAAVLASGATAIAGFAVLAFSDVAMLRDFGLRDGGRPDRLAARRAGRAARGARAGRAARAGARARGAPGPCPRERAGAVRRRRRSAPRRARAGAASAAAARGAGDDGDVAARRARDRRARLHHAQHAAHGGARARAACRWASRCRRSRRRSRCRTSTGDANVVRARRRARVRGARADISTSASWPSAGRSCWRSSPRARSAATPDRRARRRCARASPTCGSPPWRSAATATTCARAIRERGWKLPVAYDHDGAVANAYAVAICPTITFARRGRRRWTRPRSG